jgi:trehalose-6-phosphate synthase
MERILIVSNRLPVTVTRNADGFEYKPSSGGLVTALKSLKGISDFIWIGWPGNGINHVDMNRNRGI